MDRVMAWFNYSFDLLIKQLIFHCSSSSTTLLYSKTLFRLVRQTTCSSLLNQRYRFVISKIIFHWQTVK